MSFHKVVKAPAKRAHIKNYPHKKSEARDQRVSLLWYNASSLIGIIILVSGERKLYYYSQLSVVKQELKSLDCYDEQAVCCLIRQAKWEQNRY